MPAARRLAAASPPRRRLVQPGPGEEALSFARRYCVPEVPIAAHRGGHTLGLCQFQPHRTTSPERRWSSNAAPTARRRRFPSPLLGRCEWLGPQPGRLLARRDGSQTIAEILNIFRETPEFGRSLTIPPILCLVRDESARLATHPHLERLTTSGLRGTLLSVGAH